MASTTAGAGTTENPSVPPLGFGTKFSYGFGAIANGVKNAAFAADSSPARIGFFMPSNRATTMVIRS